MEIVCTVNGAQLETIIEPQELLLDFVRDRLRLTGTKRSCDVQVCGACTVLLDGTPVSACCTLAYEAHGRTVLTIEGLAEREEFGPLEEAFARHGAVQCGFCTPGILLTVHSLLSSGELEAEADIKHGLDGSLCRCTGYQGILESVRELVRARDS